MTKRALPILLTAVLTAWLLLSLRTPAPSSPLDVAGFSRLPVLNGGRLKPIDTVARTSLLLLRGKQTVRFQGRTIGADDWLLNMLYKPTDADAYPVFDIDDPDVLGVMGIAQTSNRYYSFSDLRPHLKEIEDQARQAEEAKAEQRSRYQTAVSNLQNRVILYQKLQNTLQVAGSEHMTDEVRIFQEKIGPFLMAHMAGNPKPSKELLPMIQLAERYDFMREVAEFYPSRARADLTKLDWASMGQGILDSITTVGLPPAVAAYAALGDAYRANDPAAFKKALIEYENGMQAKIPEDAAHGRSEFLFNRYEPFYKSMVLYLMVFLLALVSLLGWPQPLIRSALYVLVLAFIVHTIGLVSRMALQGRPPVTNLYSSAIFVGWAAVVLGIALERIYRNGIGSLVASAIGFTTLIIAHHLAAQGDTLEMMRAVLDSNFWLATHVVCITIGYSSTFLAGFLATCMCCGARSIRRGTRRPRPSSNAWSMGSFALAFSSVSSARSWAVFGRTSLGDASGDGTRRKTARCLSCFGTLSSSMPVLELGQAQGFRCDGRIRKYRDGRCPGSASTCWGSDCIRTASWKKRLYGS